MMFAMETISVITPIEAARTYKSHENTYRDSIYQKFCRCSFLASLLPLRVRNSALALVATAGALTVAFVGRIFQSNVRRMHDGRFETSVQNRINNRLAVCFHFALGLPKRKPE
jgi:hypothetical protein